MSCGLNNKNNKLAVITIMTLTMDLDGENSVFPFVHFSTRVLLPWAPGQAPDDCQIKRPEMFRQVG
jgi:hypothetical protein